MKKILALILAALMVLTMVACAAKAEPAADAEQTTDGTGCLGNTSTFDVKGKIRRKKPVMQSQAMLHCPVVQLFKCVPVIAKICETIHKQTISGRSSERIYNINLTLRVAFFQCLL